MQIEEVVVMPKHIYVGTDTFGLSEKGKLSIRKKIIGWENVYDSEVPTGKKWQITIRMDIEEVDA